MNANTFMPDFSHERVVVATGDRSGLTITVALHSSVLGSALGGCRMWQYDHWSEATADALRLSAAMTRKNSVAGLDAGGGKAVIMVPRGERLEGERRHEALLDLGDVIEMLGGAYRTAEDVGTTENDMAVVRERTEHVVGLPAEDGGAGEPAAGTALGVFSSIAPTLEEAFGDSGFSGRHFVISGLGQVGSRLARLIAEAGGTLSVTDIASAKRELADELGARWIDPEAALTTQGDVFIPAGLGGVLTDETIRSLPVRAVIGPANNPLGRASDADLLAKRGIVYAPDFVVNSGGVIHLEGVGAGLTEEQIESRLRGVGDTLRGVYAQAHERGVTPLAAAEAMAWERIARAKQARS